MFPCLPLEHSLWQKSKSKHRSKLHWNISSSFFKIITEVNLPRARLTETALLLSERNRAASSKIILCTTCCIKQVRCNYISQFFYQRQNLPECGGRKVQRDTAGDAESLYNQQWSEWQVKGSVKRRTNATFEHTQITNNSIISGRSEAYL